MNRRGVEGEKNTNRRCLLPSYLYVCALPCALLSTVPGTVPEVQSLTLHLPHAESAPKLPRSSPRIFNRTT